MKSIDVRNNKRRQYLIRFDTVFFWLLFILFISVPALSAQAQAPFVVCNPMPTADAYGNPFIVDMCFFDQLIEVPVRIFNWLLGIAGFVFLGVIVWGGTRMMLYYLSESPESELVNAKMTITRGIFGLLVVAFSWLIVWTLVYAVFGLRADSQVGDWLRSFNFF